MAIEEDLFRRVMGSFASGVTVVTTQVPGELPRGFTASAVSSLSLEPRLLLVCISNVSATLTAIRAAGGFAVNIMASEQQAVAHRFAGRVEAKFQGVAWAPGPLGLPVLDGALGYAECRLTDTCPGGDHTILIGEVLTAGARDASPLLYFRGSYGGYAGAVPSILYPTEGWEIW
jgi:flavin reductase (DIM6/NTAB) family NADH-FMN oxidoreductase RutF